MATITLKSEQLNLPEKIAKRLKGKELELLETKEGILLKPVGNAIKRARGFLKGSRFTSERYLKLKKEEKALEK